MTTHELAKKLLEGPDVKAVQQCAAPNCDYADEIETAEIITMYQCEMVNGQWSDLIFEPPSNRVLPLRAITVVELS
jgi:hypothetical protein